MQKTTLEATYSRNLSPFVIVKTDNCLGTDSRSDFDSNSPF